MRDTTENQVTTERWVIEVCRELKLPVESADDDIFDVGGTSLTIMRMIARAEHAFGYEVLNPDEIIEFSTIREIATTIRRNAAKAVVAADGE
jgi:non-haem Fe2+, alpha-ketoglutarate-dependent halogenase